MGQTASKVDDFFLCCFGMQNDFAVDEVKKKEPFDYREYERKLKSKQSNSLIGEDRTFGGNELFVDMIPSKCSFKNARKYIDRSDWDHLRNKVYERVNHKCECCGYQHIKNFNKSLEAHERWEFDMNTKTQKLKRFVALCSYCHYATHIGNAKRIGVDHIARKKLKKVRNFTDEELQKHIDDAYKLCAERDKYDWVQDLSILELNGYSQNFH